MKLADFDEKLYDMMRICGTRDATIFEYTALRSTKKDVKWQQRKCCEPKASEKSEAFLLPGSSKVYISAALQKVV